MVCNRIIYNAILLLCLSTLPRRVHLQWYRSLYQVIQQDHDLTGFNSIVQINRLSKQYLGYNELTVFVPTNDAFRNYKGEILENFALYHMTFEMKSLQDLNTTTYHMTPVMEDFPPLWVTRSRGDIFVNNAKIIKQQSNYLSRIRHDDFGKQQILHTIDEVLNPMILSPKFPPNAYDFLSTSFQWNLPGGTTVSEYFVKVQEHRMQHLFKDTAGHTFFIPIDSGIDSENFRKIDRHLIQGHIIPFYILFTRPTEKKFAYETLANDTFMFMVLSFMENDGKSYVKARVNGRSSNPEEFTSEIVVKNIPVKNGVVHLISKPLSVTSERPLGLFPFLPILTKLSTDPELEIFYEMGEKTEFNKIFSIESVQFTYFVPRDTAWKQADRKHLTTSEEALTILKRHLIISDSPYYIEQLESQTKANNNSDLELMSEGGPLKIMVLKIDSDYYVKWNNKYIQILRPNYECTNGIIHILAGPLTDFRRQYEMQANQYKTYWEIFKNAINKTINFLFFVVYYLGKPRRFAR